MRDCKAAPFGARPGFGLPWHARRRCRAIVLELPLHYNRKLGRRAGKIAAQVLPPGRTLVHEMDLSYAILPWHPNLKKGGAMRARYGDKVGFRYYEDEDCGIFWSNDPHLTVSEMAKSIGVPEAEDSLDRVRGVYHDAAVIGYW